MRVLVTGAKGFVGRNLCLALSRMEDVEVLRYDLGNTPEELAEWAGTCDFVFHLAGVNRPKDPAEFATGNTGFTEELLALLERRPVPVLLSSSIQAALDNPYGVSKRAAEDAVRAYGARTGAAVFVYRLANVFGKWCRPNYNSAVATWCHNRARGLDIQVRDRAAEVRLVYIDDVVQELLSALGGNAHREGDFCCVPVTHSATLGEIVALLKGFAEQPKTLMVPEIPAGSFEKKLYSTYLSYLPKEKVAFPLKMNVDERGSFTELVHTLNSGQVSINISKPGITKGQHWHNTKFEQFIVVKGHGLIQQRNLNDPDGKILEWEVSGDKIQAVHMLPGYTHNIINLSETEDLVTVMYCNEVFNPNKPDTFFDPVK